MFQKLRNKVLWMNMLLISVLICVAFTAVYFITSENTLRKAQAELGRQFMWRQSFQEIKGQKERPPQMVAPPEDHTASFVVEYSEDGGMQSVVSNMEMEEETAKRLTDAVLKRTKKVGTIKQDNKVWLYEVRKDREKHRIAFLDYTAQENILKHLIVTFFVIGLFILAAVYVISRFFANSAIRPVKEAWEKQKQFIADASHELKTPLTSINANLDVLEENGDETIVSQEKWLSHIRTESARMSKLTNDMLYLAKMDQLEVSYQTEAVNLSDEVNAAIMAMEAAYYEKLIDLKQEIADNIMVEGVREQLVRVVFILLDNALKYTESKGTVRVGLYMEGEKAVLQVTNTTEPLSQEDMRRIFDRFYRIDKSRSRESGGYGLGLSIAWSIVEKHQGKISVESKERETLFLVELPAMKKGLSV